jgi:hypothetical protein
MRELCWSGAPTAMSGVPKSTIHAVFDRRGRQARRRAAPSCGVPSMFDALEHRLG